jgi:hypothetical protein
VLIRSLRGLFTKGRSVSEDWRARLPEEKNRVFDANVQRWESAYAMLSISLNEAFSMRSQGDLVRARQQAAVCMDLVQRLAHPILGTLSLVHTCGSRIRGVSLVRPLKPEFFRGETAQRAASWHALRHGVLLSQRSRFFHKLRTLAETFEWLVIEFEVAAREIAEGTSTEPGVCWSALDTLHYDMNTCLRESVVILKSFLRALPAGELPAFRQRLESQPDATARLSRARLLRASS